MRLAVAAALPLARFLAQALIRPALERIAGVTVVPAGQAPGMLPGELGPLLRHRAALGLDGRPLLGDLLGVGSRPLPVCALVHSAMLASTHSLSLASIHSSPP